MNKNRTLICTLFLVIMCICLCSCSGQIVDDSNTTSTTSTTTEYTTEKHEITEDVVTINDEDLVENSSTTTTSTTKSATTTTKRATKKGNTNHNKSTTSSSIESIQTTVKPPAKSGPQAELDNDDFITKKPTTTTTTTQKGDTCYITIDCTEILNNMSKLKAGHEAYVPSSGYMLSNYEYTIQPNDTVLDVLQNSCNANNISLNVRSTKFSSYVAGINNIDEFDCGKTSGWMYSLNGTNPKKSCDAFTVNDGDRIVFYYVLKF